MHLLYATERGIHIRVDMIILKDDSIKFVGFVLR